MKKLRIGLSLALATCFFAAKSHAQVTLPPRTVTRIDNTVGVPGYTSKPVTITMTGKLGTIGNIMVGSHNFTFTGESFDYSGSFSGITFTATIEGVTSSAHTLPTVVNQSETIIAPELQSPTLSGGYGVTVTCTGAGQYTFKTTFFSALQN